MPCAAPCGNGIRTRCRSCSGCGWSAGWISICPGSRRRWWVIRKREPRWQSAADRARVAAELIEEAASLTDESTIATPADVARAGLPPPISVELPLSAAPGGEAGAASDAPLVAPTLDDALDRDPDNVALLVERAARLGAAQHYSAAQLDYERALRVDPAPGDSRGRGRPRVPLRRRDRPSRHHPSRPDHPRGAAARDGGRCRVFEPTAAPEGAPGGRGGCHGGRRGPPGGFRDPRGHPQRHRAGHA